MLVRMARAGDIDTIIALVRAFAGQEGSEAGLEFERDEFARNLFGGRAEAEVMLAETEAGTTTGFALFFSKFDTWTGKPGMWLGELLGLWPRRHVASRDTLQAMLRCRARPGVPQAIVPRRPWRAGATARVRVRSL